MPRRIVAAASPSVHPAGVPVTLQSCPSGTRPSGVARIPQSLSIWRWERHAFPQPACCRSSSFTMNVVAPESDHRRKRRSSTDRDDSSSSDEEEEAARKRAKKERRRRRPRTRSRARTRSQPRRRSRPRRRRGRRRGGRKRTSRRGAAASKQMPAICVLLQPGLLARRHHSHGPMLPSTTRTRTSGGRGAQRTTTRTMTT